MIADGSVERLLPTEGGSTIVELMVAAAAGLLLAAVLGHTLLSFQTAFRISSTAVDRGEQAQLALALIAHEIEAVVPMPRAHGCPPEGIVVRPGQLSLSANLYDRTAWLREPASIGTSEVVLGLAGSFEVNDLVVVTDVGDVSDPSDDGSQCVRITAIFGDRVAVDAPLTRHFPSESPMALVNLVTYRVDGRGRLMRTQDGGTQRVAQDVVAFDARRDREHAILSLTMRDALPWMRYVPLRLANGASI